MKGNWETAPLVRAWLCKREGLCSDSYVKASMTEYACNPGSREKTGKPKILLAGQHSHSSGLAVL